MLDESFQAEFLAYSDDKLLEIVNDPNGYFPEVVEAAISELASRGMPLSEDQSRSVRDCIQEDNLAPASTLDPNIEDTLARMRRTRSFRSISFVVVILAAIVALLLSSITRIPWVVAVFALVVARIYAGAARSMACPRCDKAFGPGRCCSSCGLHIDGQKFTAASYLEVCPACAMFEAREGICKLHSFNVIEYPTQFLRDCAGGDFKRVSKLSRGFVCLACGGTIELDPEEQSTFRFVCPLCGRKYDFQQPGAA